MDKVLAQNWEIVMMAVAALVMSGFLPSPRRRRRGSRAGRSVRPARWTPLRLAAACLACAGLLAGALALVGWTASSSQAGAAFRAMLSPFVSLARWTMYGLLAAAVAGCLFALLAARGGAVARISLRRPRERTDAERAGLQGEMLVRREIRSLGYRAVHDVCLPLGSGATQIDHIVEVGSSIVCIETKHWAGKVFGTYHDAVWTHVSAGKKNVRQNPVRQNEAHVAAIAKFMGGDVRSWVLMTGSAVFKERPRGVYGLADLENCLQTVKMMNPDDFRSRKRWDRLEAMASSVLHDEMRDRHVETIVRRGAGVA